MKKHLLILLFLFSKVGTSEVTETPTVTEIPEPPEIKLLVNDPPTQKGAIPKPKWVGKLVSLGARVDAAYSGGGAISQGFYIPSLRLTAYGEAGEFIDYRISLAQTREYSSAMLPQMLPSDAYVDLSTDPIRNGERTTGSDVRLRFGLMPPLHNPMWSSDLSDLPLPDYHEIHKANFMSRDLGAEIAARPYGESLTFSAGAFNGSGITTLNTNNAKAFSASVHGLIKGDEFKIGFGNGSYFSEQSVRGAINYRRQWNSDFFAYFDWKQLEISLYLDLFISEFEDTTRSISPNGYAGALFIGVTDWMDIFTRYESCTDSPQKGKIKSYQVGPMLKLSDYARAFILFQSLQVSNTEERSIFLRIRLSV